MASTERHVDTAEGEEGLWSQCFQEERREYIGEKDSYVKMMGNVLQDSGVSGGFTTVCYTL